MMKLKSLLPSPKQYPAPTQTQRDCLNAITAVWKETVDKIRDGYFNNEELAAIAQQWEGLREGSR